MVRKQIEAIGGNMNGPKHPEWGKHGFKANPENINRNGRPKKIENVVGDLFINEFNLRLSKSQCHEIIESLLTMTHGEITKLGERTDVPFWMKMIAKKMERDLNKGSVHLMEVLFDRVFGKPKETIDTINTSPEPIISIDVVQSTIPLAGNESEIIE
jgi:hypothetical protein